MRLIDFIIAEDVRLEAGSKVSLMGVFDDEILIAVDEASVHWPLPLRITCFVRARIEETDAEPAKATLVIKHGLNVVAQIEGTASRTEGDRPVTTLKMPFPSMVLSLPGPGRLLFELEVSATDEQQLLKVDHSLEVVCTA